MRRGVAAAPEGLVVNLQRTDEATVLLRGEAGEADTAFALRRDMGEVVANFGGAGGAVASLETLLNDVTETRIADNADGLATSGALRLSMTAERGERSDAIVALETKFSGLADDAAAAALEDRNTLTAADMRFASLSGTFVAVSNSHENNDGTHDDLSEKVTETLGEEVCLA